MKPSPSQDYILEIVRNFVAHNKDYKVKGINLSDLQEITGLSGERMRQIKNILIKKGQIRLKMGKRSEVWIPTK